MADIDQPSVESASAIAPAVESPPVSAPTRLPEDKEDSIAVPAERRRNKGKEKIAHDDETIADAPQPPSPRREAAVFRVPEVPARVIERKAKEEKKRNLSDLFAQMGSGTAFLIGLLIPLIWFIVLSPGGGSITQSSSSRVPEWHAEMVASGLSAAYMNADAAAVELYHKKRQLSYHPIEHISFIIPSKTQWNIKKYFMDRLGTSVISGEAWLLDAERKGFYIRKTESFVVDRYSPTTRNVLPSLLNMARVEEEIAKNLKKYVVSKNLFGCISSHELGITASFVVMRISEKKLAAESTAFTALDFLMRVANSTRRTFPEHDPKGVYFHLLDPQILPESDDLNVILASRPTRERPVVYRDYLGEPSGSNRASVEFLIENRIHGTHSAPVYSYAGDYASFTAPGEVAIRYLDAKSGAYKTAVVKGEMIGCIEKSQRYANAKGFDPRRLVSREYLEGKMEEAGGRSGLMSSEQRLAEERKRVEKEKLEKEIAALKQRMEDANKPADQPVYGYDDISAEEEQEMKESDASLSAISSAIGRSGDGDEN